MPGYVACVDEPASFYRKQLAQAFPEALVILSIRDTDSWWHSVLHLENHFVEEARDSGQWGNLCRRQQLASAALPADPASPQQAGGLNFWPRSNVKLSLQYTLYQRFNGSRRDFDGAGRDASDNDTVYLEAWIAF